MHKRIPKMVSWTKFSTHLICTWLIKRMQTIWILNRVHWCVNSLKKNLVLYSLRIMNVFFFRRKWHCFWQNIILFAKRRCFHIWMHRLNGIFLNSIFRRILYLYGSYYIYNFFFFFFLLILLKNVFFTRRGFECEKQFPIVGLQNQTWNEYAYERTYTNNILRALQTFWQLQIHNSTSSVSHVRVFRC